MWNLTGVLRKKTRLSDTEQFPDVKVEFGPPLIKKMIFRLFLMSLFLSTLSQSMDEVFVSSITIGIDKPTFSCKMLNGFQIDSQNYTASCNNNNNGNRVILIAYKSQSFTSKNLTFHMNLTDYNTFSGFLVINESLPANTIQLSDVILSAVHEPVTTPSPTTTTSPPSNATTTNPKNIRESLAVQEDTANIRVEWTRIRFDESKQSGNGAAVAVAVIEGIALIGILGFMGYRTMRSGRSTTTPHINPANYYDNNARSNVDSMRMSDIPPPRDHNYSTPYSSSSTPNRTIITSTPDLVVPSSNPPPTTTQQFNDPFATLDSW